MFGGRGYYANGKVFALVREESLYLKAGSANVADFLLSGQLPYIHQCFGDFFPTKFYPVPLTIIEDEAQLARWMERTILVLDEGQGSSIA
ncbi:hypothetical protein PsAD2_03120 [Pseudovibrio axinellae]|uniref:TfoX N-terminal domain-containing protein n=2 Tax=Pseudovibrio axinellae TaxID=989403 RepID=A0A165XCZ3_9HYPH|nr:hypothetical protein PsAD2_03120 [Pseudovibrio axinellae]SER31951.1 DNA transformation protein [Pseudovibrio axinellae]